MKQFPVIRAAVSVGAVIGCFAPVSGHSAETAQAAIKDAGEYFTAPIRWDGGDWAYFGASIAAIAIAHHYDDSVRNHFVDPGSTSADSSSHSLDDAVPAIVALAGTWLYASAIDSSDGRREAWSMAEAAGLSAVSSFAMTFVAGREGPDKTSDPDAWFSGGDSFPSQHAAVAFAIGSVLAESGSDDYRWTRRVVGYGIGVGTSYLRLKHNQHWLSDTVASAALGISTGYFVMNRHGGSHHLAGLMVLPTENGLMLTYSVALR